MKIPALLAALIITAASLALTSCDNGNCSSAPSTSSSIQLTSLTTKGGGGHGGGEGGGGHAGGESTGDSAGHAEDTTNGVNGVNGTTVIPHSGSGSDSCKKQN